MPQGNTEKCREVQRNTEKNKEELGEYPTKEGDDTMSAVTQNFVYQVCGKKEAPKKEPAVTQDRLASIKATVGKYLTEKK